MPAERVYIKIERRTMVKSQDVMLGDIAKIACRNKNIAYRLKTIKIVQLDPKKTRQEVVSIMKVISLIQKVAPDVQIENQGEKDFIICLEKQKQNEKLIMWSKTLLVCVIVFFGGSFTIITFHNDVDLPGAFSKIYTLIMGQKPDGFSILEVSYSIGLAIGILVFFNHFGGKFLTDDPTPMQVEMKTYEEDVDKTIVEEKNRKGIDIDVD